MIRSDVGVTAFARLLTETVSSCELARPVFETCLDFVPPGRGVFGLFVIARPCMTECVDPDTHRIEADLRVQCLCNLFESLGEAPERRPHRSDPAACRHL